MNLYILRHASAGTRRANPLLDINRPLDKEGKQHCIQLGYVLNALNIQFELIVSSHLKRSLQTASFIGTETSYDGEILQSKALAPAAGFTEFQQLLHHCSTAENVLVVGHNPNITEFLGSLLVPPDRQPAKIRLRKGSIARLNLQRRPATLQWLLDPRIVRALYATSTASSRRKTSRK